MLISQSESTIGTRFIGVSKAEKDAKGQALLAEYDRRLTDCLRLPLPQQEGVFCPRRVALSSEAKQVFTVFYNRLEADMAEGKRLCNVRGSASKACEQAIRMAAVLAFIETPSLHLRSLMP